MEWIKQEVKNIEQELLQVRRALHKIPEIGDQLPRTKQFVCDYLDDIDVPYRSVKDCDGVVAEIKGGQLGKTVAFRGDMDGLHIVEETEIPFRSEIPGQMHGCGHDAHTAMLLLTAKLLQARCEELRGNVRLLFQTGEECAAGAIKMIADGALEGVDAIFAAHVGNLAGNTPAAGDVLIPMGAASAGKSKFIITVKGKGTHSAFPEKGIDPILMAARIVNGCEELAARELPAGAAAVLSFGSLQAGEDHNTIPETAVIKGSIRCQDDGLKAFLETRLCEISAGIASAYRGECHVEIIPGSNTIMNHEATARLAAEAVSDVVGREKVFTQPPCALMAADDFVNYSARVPGVYFLLHTNNAEKGITESNHSPRFDIDESVLWEGVAAYIAIAEKYLG